MLFGILDKETDVRIPKNSIGILIYGSYYSFLFDSLMSYFWDQEGILCKAPSV